MTSRTIAEGSVWQRMCRNGEVQVGGSVAIRPDDPAGGQFSRTGQSREVVSSINTTSISTRACYYLDN
jgi:hypothetical protein